MYIRNCNNMPRRELLANAPKGGSRFGSLQTEAFCDIEISQASASSRLLPDTHLFIFERDLGLVSPYERHLNKW